MAKEASSTAADDGEEDVDEEEEEEEEEEDEREDAKDEVMACGVGGRGGERQLGGGTGKEGMVM